MSRSGLIYRCLFVLCISGLLWAPTADAQSENKKERRLDELVQKYLGIFVVTPERRDPSESVEFKDGVLRVVYRWSGRKPQRELVCAGGRWLAVGRLANVEGARALFRRATRLRRIVLTFVDVSTSVQPIGDGKYRQKRSVKELARFELTRAQANKLDPKVLRQTLKGQRCVRFVKSLLDEVRVQGTKLEP